jgi:D-aspartate ligase
MVSANKMVLEDTSTPAVVFGCFGHHGLGVTRSLGRLGVQVYCVDKNRFTPSFLSRYCRGKFLWDLHRASTEEMVSFLMEVGRKIGRRSVLIPTSDIGAMFVADQKDRLVDQFIFPDQDAGLARSLCSKRDMYYLAKKWDIPTAETAFPKSRMEVHAYLETARFPIMLKPIYSNVPGSLVKSMVVVHTPRELLDEYDKNPLPGNLMFQEYIPGDEDTVWMFDGYFNEHSDCQVGFTGRKLRQTPPHKGQTSLGICLRNEEVETTTLRFMKSIGYKGVLDIGYRYDARDGRYKVLDVNPRVGATFRLFVSENTMDVVRALYQDMTGQPVSSTSTPEGRKWIVEDLDLFSLLRCRRAGRFGIGEWIRSLHEAEEGAYIALDDLWPIAGACVNNAGKMFRQAHLLVSRLGRTSTMHP